MVVHINVLSSGVEDGILRKLDVDEVVAVDRRRIGHLMQVRRVAASTIWLRMSR